MTLTEAWGSIRAVLEDKSFNSIKRVVGLAGIDMSVLSHLVQKQGSGGSTKGQLLTTIDAEFGKMPEQRKKHFATIVVENLIQDDPCNQERLDEYLSRHGFGIVDNQLVPLELFDPADLAQLPDAPRTDLVKAAQRFRDGDISGAISAACGAVDTVTSSIYADCSLGDPTKASFQERCSRALDARTVPSNIENQLQDLGWDMETSKKLAENLKGALNQGAYVMQTLRSKMGDVHGTKPILKPLAFDVLKWAELFVRTYACTVRD